MNSTINHFFLHFISNGTQEACDCPNTIHSRTKHFKTKIEMFFENDHNSLDK